MVDQNRFLLDIIKSEKVSSSDVTKPTYMKDVPKPTTWNTQDKRNVEAFVTKYEIYCDASGYHSDKVKVRSFGLFLKKGTPIKFAAWRNSRAEDLAWKELKEWAIVMWRKLHQHLLHVLSLGAMKWRPEQNLSRYAEEYFQGLVQIARG